MTSYALRRPPSGTQAFVIGLSLFIAAIPFFGFWRSYFGPLLQGVAGHPGFIHVHAAIYVGWIALFVAQVFLASSGRIGLHRRFGKIGVVYGVVVIAVGLFTAWSQFALRVEAGMLAEAQNRLLAPLTDMIVFPIFFGAALYYRRRPELHKRLMIVATTTLLVAAALRLPLPLPARLLVWFSPILLAMAYDVATRRMLHPAYAVGLAALILLSQRRFLAGTDAWLGFSGWLARFVG
jgi:hypothetical protein